MFEEYDFDYIMDQMMTRMPDGINTEEGSLVYNACSRCAAQIEELYGNLGDVYDNILIDGQDIDHLISSGAEVGVPYNEATPAVFSAKFNCAMELDTVVQATEADFDYDIIECLDDAQHIYKIESIEAGTEANNYLGDLEPEEYVADFEEGQILELLQAGTDDEDEEVYRFRRYEAFQIKPYAGNRAYYKQEIGGMDGVGGVKAQRASSTGQSIPIYITSETYGVPSAATIAAVTAAVAGDGEGDGLAPIGALVTVNGVTGTTITVSLTLTCKTGYTAEGLRSYIEAAIDEYFLALGKDWENLDHITVRKSKIEAAITDIEGVEDVSNLTLNGSAANVVLGAYAVPVRGTVTITTP